MITIIDAGQRQKIAAPKFDPKPGDRIPSMRWVRTGGGVHVLQVRELVQERGKDVYRWLDVPLTDNI